MEKTFPILILPEKYNLNSYSEFVSMATLTRTMTSQYEDWRSVKYLLVEGERQLTSVVRLRLTVKSAC